MEDLHDLFRDELPLYSCCSGRARYAVLSAVEPVLQALGFFFFCAACTHCTVAGTISEAISSGNMHLLRRTSLEFEPSLHICRVARCA